MIVYQLESKSKFRLMCESMTYFFNIHFLRYVVGIGVVGGVKYSYNIHIEVRGC